MKSYPFTLCLIIAMLSMMNAGCKKDGGIRPIHPLQANNSAPEVQAGSDIRLEIPFNSTMLGGTVHDANANIRSLIWKKISGPESYFLDQPDNLRTNLIWLEEGDYEFELTATDKEGLFDMDTVKVTVFTNLKKYTIKNITQNTSGFLEAQLPTEVINTIKWVFGISAGRWERADARIYPDIDYSAGGYYYDLLPGNLIALYNGNTGSSVDVIIFY